MAFGILGCKHLESPPGTACLNDQSDLPPDLDGIPAERLKHGAGRYSHVILVPQPSDSPNDPLNWPLRKKDTVLAIVSLYAAVVGALGPMLGPGFVTISEEMGISIDTLSQSTAWLILAIAASVFLINPASKKYGKRPVYVFCAVILLVVSIWGAAATSYRSFLASRIVSGMGMAPYEILVQSTIGDLYFVHQRATRLAAWNLMLLCGIAGASFISGYIIEDLGYRWTFGLCAIFFGVFGFLIFFFVPETAYRRSAVERTPSIEKKICDVEHDSCKELREVQLECTPQSALTEPRTSYFGSLRVFSGRYSDAPLRKVLARPFIMFWYPAILWAFLIYGTLLTWIVVFSVVNGVIFVSPPYNFSVSQAGLTGLSPFVMTLAGELVSGPLNDWICLKLTKRNHGIYEPEFRLVLMAVVAVLGAAGFFGFGATVHYVTHWSGPVLAYGIANMALAFATTCVFGYILDSYPSLSAEAFVAINSRNFLTFGLTYFVNDWLSKQGALAVFSILGACFLAVCALTIPLWVFGKRIRSKIARNQFLNRFMHD